ncbi:MAG: hypothetical protein ACLPWO_04850 [Thermoplasmata archaeon]
MQSSGSRDSNLRRSRVPCKVCGVPTDLAHMREHLRTEHQLGSAEVDTAFLDARIEARRSRRSHSP